MYGTLKDRRHDLPDSSCIVKTDEIDDDENISENTSKKIQISLFLKLFRS